MAAESIVAFDRGELGAMVAELDRSLVPQIEAATGHLPRGIGRKVLS
jgi:hypothetical protein